MKTNRIRAALKAGKNVIGTFVATPDPSIVELLGYAGFDYLIMDMEHGPLDTVLMENMLRAADASGTVPTVRVTQNNPSLILRALDCGAMGVVIPQVNDVTSATAAAKSMRYAPAGGYRGMALGTRVTNYGMIGRDEALQFAAEGPLAILQAESKECLQNLSEIVKIPGVDMMYIGPTDLSQFLGYPAQIDHPEVQKAIHQIADTTRAAGLYVGMFVRSAEEAKYWAGQGIQFLTVGGDKGYMFRAVRETIKALESIK